MVFYLPGAAFAKDSIKIVINKKVNKLAYLKNGEVIKIFPVATGAKPDYTPEGSFKVVRKIVNPYYSKLKIPGGSPNNPLGARWLGLDARGTSGGTYGIHGTNNPNSIGKYVSAGCIRMYNQDVIWLYENTPLQTPVEIINGPWDLEQKPVNIKINGQVLNQDAEAKAYMVDNRVMVPCRLVAEAMGCKVYWDAAAEKVTITKGTGQLSITLGCNELYLNGTPGKMDVAPVLKKGRVFMHVRPLGEAFGFKVNWEQETYTVLLTK